MKRLAWFFIAVLLLSALSGCVHGELFRPWETPSPSSGEADSPPPSEHPGPSIPMRGYSEYARGFLSSSQQKVYDQVTTAVYNVQEKLIIQDMDNEEIEKILRYFQKDHPAVDWLKGEYRVRRYPAGKKTELFLNYCYTKKEIFARIDRLEEEAAALLGHMSASLSDFDTAVILHDRLLERVEYDLEAKYRDDVYGALVEGRAACEGYSRAYQYLLLRAGLEAIIVYGMADEAHAWNMVRLDGEYYLADPTWDDATLSDGSSFLSHQYLFWDDSVFSQTHTPDENGLNIPLPACNRKKLNYFYQTGAIIQETDEEVIREAMTRAIDVALANSYRCAEIYVPAFTDADELRRTLIDSGIADRIFTRQAELRSTAPCGKAFEPKMMTLIYMLEEQE